MRGVKRPLVGYGLPEPRCRKAAWRPPCRLEEKKSGDATDCQPHTSLTTQPEPVGSPGRAMEAPTVRVDDGCPNLCADRPLKGTLATAETHVLDAVDGNGDEGGSRESQGEFGATTSTEETVDDSNGILSLCFGDWSSTAGNSDAVMVIAEEKFLQGDEIWNALTKSYGQVTEMDRKQSLTRSLHMPAFNPEENVSQTSDFTADVSEVEEELREQLDMHAIIVPCLGEEPLFTAEQVIEEIEEMMQDSSESVAEHNPSQPDLSMLSLDVQRPRRSPSYEERVRRLNVAELNERVGEMESAVTRLSEELVQHLALRDELDFEKEVKNTFISALIDVQNRQKEHREALKKKKKQHQQLQGATGKSHGHAAKSLRSRFSMEGLSSVLQNSFRQTFGSRCSERQYLTTVIPYEKKGRPPSMEDLQTLIKILHAMRDDSDKVPALLTDYILKVLCPT